MRDIKFRAWDIKNKEYFELNRITGLHYYEDTITLWYTDEDELSNYKKFHVRGIIIELYTGLKDKNGKELYEGDTCRYDAIHNKVCQIVWDNGLSRFIIQTPKKCDYAGLTKYTRLEIEIIGNIHE